MEAPEVIKSSPAKLYHGEEEQNSQVGHGDILPLPDTHYGVNLTIFAKDSVDKKKNLPTGKLKSLISRLASTQGCAPRTNITFIKVHKTGSSTVQNIFLRYGDKHNLSFVLPPVGHHLGYPHSFERKHMIPSNINNIFCHHARFSLNIPHIMPPNTVYISIVRDPVKVFESSFIYFKIDYRLGMVNDPQALAKFLAEPDRLYEGAANKVHLKNPMLYDFGLDPTSFDDINKIEKAIRIFEKRFHLMMVAEYFEESLILLRDLLCWRTEDVVVFKMNARNENSIHPLSEKDQQDIRNWNMGDVKLYDYFNATIQRKIESYGRDKMQEEVTKLRQKTDQLFARCIQSDTASREKGDFKVWQPPGVKINAFVLKEDAKEDILCQRMIEPEIQYTQFLREKQFPTWKNGQVDMNMHRLRKVNLKPKKEKIFGNLKRH